MFSYTTLKNVIGRDVALSQYMIDAINEWKSMLNGSAEWCDDSVESLKLEEESAGSSQTQYWWSWMHKY